MHVQSQGWLTWKQKSLPHIGEGTLTIQKRTQEVSVLLLVASIASNI